MIDTGTNTGKAAFGAALAAVVIGVCVLAGWLFGLEFLKRIAPGLVAMNPATAVAFILAGASLVLFLQSRHGRDQKSRALILTARLCAVVVVLIGLARLVGFFRGWEFGVDRWLFASKLPGGVRFQNRMAPNTALNFLLLGFALLFVDVKNRSVRLCVEFSIVVVGFGSLLAILGYIYDIQSFYGVGLFSQMALHTAITFSVLSVAFLLSHTDSGLLAVFVGDSAGGTMARRLLPAAVLVPAVLGWFRLQGEKAGLYQGDFGVAVFAVGNIVVFTFLVCWSAQGLFSADLGRKKAEEALRLLSSAVEQSKESIVITDAELNLPGPKILFVNPAFTKMTGYTAEEVIGKTPRILQGPRTDKTVLSRLRQNLERGEAFEGEAINYRKDGTEFNLEWQIAPIRNAGGTITHFVALQHDITERKRSGDALEERARLAVLEADVGTALTRGETLAEMLRLCSEAIVKHLDAAFARIWTLNEREKMLELQASAGMYTHLNGPHGRVPVGKFKIGLIAEERMPHLTNQVGGDPRVGDQEWAKREGMVAFAGYPLLVGDQLVGVVAMFARHTLTDTTLQALASISNNIALGVEHKRAEAALQSSEAHTKAIVQSSLDCIVSINHEGKILEFNPAAEKVFGYARADVLGRELAQVIIPPALRERHRQGMKHYLATGEARVMGKRIEITAIRSDGSEFPVELAITRMGAETPPTFTGFIRDISERKRLEAQLFQSQKMETVGKLAGGIAHEFNSILTAIIGQSALLLDDLPAGSPLVKNATEIGKAADRAAVLTRQLLAYGRKQILQPEILDLNSVLAGMDSTLRHLMGRDADVRITPAAGLKAVKADAGQIEQVIMNMAINAADAMPNGGKLTLETANVTLNQQYVSRFLELKAGEYVMLAVTDTGAGMNEEIKARVFEPFFTTKGIGQGTGLGLSTCYGIVKQSGGHISVYSEPGRGATFKIYLPQVEQQTKIPLRRLDSPDLSRGTETILLVEDDPALCEMAATLLRRLGYTVLAAANGIEALKLTHQQGRGHIDLLFTDVVMPHMSGKELADRVRALYPHTRILFTSAYTENAIVHQGVLNKGVAFLPKPFTPSALASKVREVLDEPSAPKPGTAQETFGFTKVAAGVNTP